MKTLKLLLIVLLFSSCHSISNEVSLIVNKAELNSGEGAKYSYYINSFPADFIMYSNEIYNVGDTLKLSVNKKQEENGK